MASVSRYKQRRDERTLVVDLGEVITILGDHEVQDLSAEFPPSVVAATRASDLGWGDHRRRSVRIPLRTAVRDLNIGTASAGGNLAGQGQLTMLNAITGASTVLGAGANLIDVPRGPSPGIPEVSRPFDDFGNVVGPPAAELEGFVAEGGSVVQADLEFALSNATFKTVGGTVKISRRLVNQGGPAAMALIQRELLNMIAGRLDYALLSGRGTYNEPFGLVSLAEIPELTLADRPIGWTHVTASVLQALGGGARWDRLSWSGAAGAFTLLQERAVQVAAVTVTNTTASPLYTYAVTPICSEGKIDGRPCFPSRQTNQMFLCVGDFTNAYVLVQDGITLIVDPRSDLAGSLRVTVLVDVAVVIARKGAFARIVNFT